MKTPTAEPGALAMVCQEETCAWSRPSVAATG